MPTQMVMNANLIDLLAADEDTLLEHLGMRAKAAQAGQLEALDYAAVPIYDAVIMGPMDEVRTLGRRLLGRWNRELFKVMCGDEATDAKDRESLLSAIGVSDVAVAAAMTSILVGSFAVAPAVATVVSALVVKRLLRPGAEIVCSYWEEQLKTV